MLRVLLVGVVVLGILTVIAIPNRFRIAFPFATSGEPIPPTESAPAVPNGKPFEDEPYFTIVQLDESTFAIAEPKSWAKNVNYLILGDERALLFDAGVGHYDIRPVVQSLTDLPVTFMPSHFHYDHTGQNLTFDRIAIVDLPHIREQADGNMLTLTWEQHLGSAEDIPLPTWTVDAWIAPGAQIELGNRQLTLLYTPGHTDNSVSLLDRDAAILFCGDFINPEAMSAFTPTANLGDYLQASELVLRATEPQPDILMRGAHAPEAGELPVRTRSDVSNLRDQLVRIREGELSGVGVYPTFYVIADDLTLQTEPRWLQNWSPTYPESAFPQQN